MTYISQKHNDNGKKKRGNIIFYASYYLHFTSTPDSEHALLGIAAKAWRWKLLCCYYRDAITCLIVVYDEIEWQLTGNISKQRFSTTFFPRYPRVLRHGPSFPVSRWADGHMYAITHPDLILW